MSFGKDFFDRIYRILRIKMNKKYPVNPNLYSYLNPLLCVYSL